MLFLAELDHVKSGLPLTSDAGREFIERIILPTLAQAEKLVSEKKMLAGGAVAGRIALRFILEAETPQEVDQIISSLPLWPLGDTRITPLVAFADRRSSVHSILETLVPGA